MADASSVLTPWWTFYAMTGASAATLTGLMFVVVTLVSRVQMPQTADAGLSTFSTPTVVHFGAALLVSALLIAPWHSLVAAATFLALGGLYGVFHMVRVPGRAKRLTTYDPDLEDWIWYTVIPTIAYVAVFAGAIVLPAAPYAATFVLAAAVLLLIFMGIRNSWDVVTYITVSRLGEPPQG